MDQPTKRPPSPALLATIGAIAVAMVLGIVAAAIFVDDAAKLATVIGTISAVIGGTVTALVVVLQADVKDLHVQLNSRLSLLLEQTAAASEAAGRAAALIEGEAKGKAAAEALSAARAEAPAALPEQASPVESMVIVTGADLEARGPISKDAKP